MCILFLAIKQDPDFPLIILANRDEFHSRPTGKAQFWKENSNVLGGIDEKDGGTWLGITKLGRISALTNYRNIPLHKDGRISRGFLVKDFLFSEENPKNYLEGIISKRENYNPFNLLVGNPNELYVYNNVSNELRKLENGFHGLSNAFLNSPWPKLCNGVENLKKQIITGNIDKDEFFRIMKDETKAPDNLLPDTGVGLEKERFLSSIFIKDEIYGTRTTAVILLDKENKIYFEERTYNGQGIETGRVDYNFKIS
ncbi:MAG: NRDE family protein [Leptospiraceae bacterium]|nr:NRDE family protein [Leptospiraceae bacterium]